MTDKQLKRLRRSDLLEILIDLSKENERLRKQLEQLQMQIEDREIRIRRSGSLADAALQLNGVFEAAEAACEQYTQNMQLRLEQQEQLCRQMEQETKAKCDMLLAQAKRQAAAYLEEANRQTAK